MASKSSLRKGKSLAWETTTPTFDESRRSHVFMFMNTMWRLEMYAYKSSPSYYKIFLKNCNKKDPLQPFQVTTFIEDRRNNDEMQCSRLTILSDFEVLYKANFQDISKKCPGIESYNDLVVVCDFYPSSELVLCGGIEKGSILRLRQRLVWNATIPPYFDDRGALKDHCDSPNFTLMNSRWCLRLLQQYDAIRYLKILLICKGDFHPLEVKTFLEDRMNDTRIHCSRVIVSSKREVLYKASDSSISERLPAFKLDDNVNIVCIFNLPEIDFKATAQCPQSQNAGNDSSSNLSTNLEFLPGFESLSEDLGHLLDQSLMADIQLKSGRELIPAHRVILASRSEVFAAMFRHQMAESENGIIDIKDIKPSVLRPFLRYLYSGKMPENLPEEIICELYTVSDKYAVSALQKLCLRYMTRNLNNENFTKILMLADTHSDKELKESAAAFITGKPGLLTTDIWKLFSENFPKLANEMYGKCMTKMLSK